MTHELMALRSTPGNVPISSDDDDAEDPLESLLTGMNLGRYHHRSRSFFPTVLFIGMICITLGFASGYIGFLIIDKTKFPPVVALTGVNHDASYLVNEIKISNIDEHIRVLGNISKDADQIQYINKHFIKHGFDPVISSLNVFSTITGSQEPDRLVVLSSNHSTSGALLELARVFTTLRPHRSILFLAWSQDISNEWLQLLDRNIVAVVEVDWIENSFVLDVSPLLYKAIQETNVNTSSMPISLVTSQHGIPSVGIQYNSSRKLSGPRVNEPLLKLWTGLTWSLVATPVLPLRVEEFADFLTNTYPGSEGTLSEALKNLTVVAQNFDKELEDLSKTNNLKIRIKNDVLMNLEKSCIRRSNENTLFHCVQHSIHCLQGDFLPMEENKNIV